MRTNLALWGERYNLNTHALTKSVIEKVQSSLNSEKELYLALLHFLHASGKAAEDGLDADSKALLIKSGDIYAAISNPLKIREEVEAMLDELSSQGENPDKSWQVKSFRLASFLMQLPFDTVTMELILDAATLLSRSLSLPADCSYTLLFYIFEQLKNPLHKRAFAAVEPDFWENYLAVMLKMMGRFLHDAVMEYVIYYELPPGGSNETHLKLCEMLCRVAVKCCYLVHKASGFVETEIDKKIYQFCTDTILNKDPKPYSRFIERRFLHHFAERDHQQVYCVGD